MKSRSMIARAHYLAIVCLLVGIATSAYAVPPQQVQRRLDSQVFTGVCCQAWGETVSATEPATVVPVVVTWSAEFSAPIAVPFLAGLSVNNGPCSFFGAGSIDTPLVVDNGRQFDVRTLRSVILPNQGLRQGNNTFSICGGGLAATSTITIGFNTLEVRLAK